MHEYIDLGVHAFPEGADTLKRLKLSACSLDFSQIVVTAHSPYWSLFPDSSLPLGVEIVAATVRDLRKKIAFFRDMTTIVSVHGGDERINRAAYKDDRVDILMHPERGKYSGMNQVTAKFAEKNEVALGMSLDYFWKTKELERSRLLAFQRRNVALCRKFGVQFIITSNAYSHFDLRTPRQLKTLASLLLLTDEEAEIALSKAPLNILKKREQKEE
ncbi:MAG: RNase P subunit p30 family protein [Halobacteriota archaeon]